MKDASAGLRELLAGFEAAASVEVALLAFVKRLEFDYAESQDIALYIFGLRCFFCWHRASEFLKSPDAIHRVQEAWISQNESIYTLWLASAEDNPETLKWAKWTFQAKMAILKEVAEGVL